MKKILVPTDFSETSYYAVETAANLARQMDACIYLLHAIELPKYELNDSTATYREGTDSIGIAEEVRDSFTRLKNQPIFKGLTVAEVFLFDNVHQAIINKAAEHEVDLIVMGSHGTHGWNDLFVGSNTERIIRMANCPVLTIKGEMKAFEPKNIVFASNFYGEASEGFGKIKKFIELFDARVHLLKVITANRFENTTYSKKLVKEFADQNNLTNYTINVFNAETIEDGVLEFSELIEADLITMETHGRTGLYHLLVGSVTEDVANHAQRPVLSVKIPKTEVEYRPIFPGGTYLP